MAAGMENTDKAVNNMMGGTARSMVQNFFMMGEGNGFSFRHQTFCGSRKLAGGRKYGERA
jgi:hypothetical protein